MRLKTHTPRWALFKRSPPYMLGGWDPQSRAWIRSHIILCHITPISLHLCSFQTKYCLLEAMNPSGSKFSFPWRSKGKPKEPTDSVQSPGSSLTHLRPFIPTSDIPEIERWRRLILRRKGFIHAEAEKGKRKTKASSGTEDVSRRPSLGHCQPATDWSLRYQNNSTKSSFAN
jgi:hypothetical protein